MFSRESLWCFDYPVLIVLLLHYLRSRGVCWEVVYSIVVIIPLVESSSGMKILHGGGGWDVERWLELRNNCDWFTCLSYLLYIHSFIVDLYSYNKIALSTSNSYLEDHEEEVQNPSQGIQLLIFLWVIVCIISFYFALDFDLISFTPIHPPKCNFNWYQSRSLIFCLTSLEKS